MKDYLVRLTPYGCHLLMNFIDSGERRPLDEIRRLRRLTNYLIEQQGDYHAQVDEITFKSRQAREEVPVTPQGPWVQEMSRINTIENAAMAELEKSYADPVTLTLSETDLTAIRKWWKEIQAFPSQGIVADTVLAIDDALKSPEEVEREGSESERPALPHISELRRKKARR